MLESSDGVAATSSSDDEASTSGVPVGVLPPPPSLRGKLPRKHWSALALAFLGDSVWEMYVRRHHFFPPRAMTLYHSDVKAAVRAEAQDAMYHRLRGSDVLTPEEADVLRWGRNATGTVPKRFAAAGISTRTYRHATALEVLAGYLYLTSPGRLHEVMGFLGLDGSAGGSAGSSSSSSVDAAAPSAAALGPGAATRCEAAFSSGSSSDWGDSDDGRLSLGASLETLHLVVDSESYSD